MSDPGAERWQPHGKVFLWKHRHGSMREWNMMADDAACESLLDLLSRMERAQWPSKKLIPVEKPTLTPDRGADDGFRGTTGLTLSCRKGIVPDDYWLLEERDEGLGLTLGLARLQELRQAILDMKRGDGDYAIGADSGRLWIWWYIQQPCRNG